MPCWVQSFAVADGVVYTDFEGGRGGWSCRRVDGYGLWEDAIETGTRVRLRPEFFTYSRPHLLNHARQADVGVVSPPSKQSPSMARLYTIVRFDQCGHDHRLLNEELDVVR